jgi:hypothetical protein
LESTEKEKIPEKMNSKDLNAIEFNNSSFDFLIKPTSFKAQLFRDVSLKPLRKRKKPRFKINTIMNNIHIDVDENKIQNLSTVIKNINIYNNKLSCSHLSKANEKDSRAKDLWKYSVKCVLYLTKKPKMKDLIQWAHDLSVYSKIYESILSSRIDSTVVVDTNSNNDEKLRIEKEWDLNRLSTIK